MATRALWKGAISFGLVHIPVALHSATSSSGIDFDWLDRRSMDPVGYKRINKKTGKEISQEDIVKGVEYKSGEYVVLSEDEIRGAYPKTTQTIEIESFVPEDQIPMIYFERPYYIAPGDKAKKVFALLRETLKQTRQVGIARVVIQTKQHLAVLAPAGAGMVLNLLRWAQDIRPAEGLELPPESAKDAGISDKELAMARQLVKDMAGKWEPDQFTDSFREKIMALVERKVKEGKLEAVAQPGEDTSDAESSGAQVIDLTELLRRSLRKGAASAREPDGKAEDKDAKAKPKSGASAPRKSAKSAGAAPKRKAA